MEIKLKLKRYWKWNFFLAYVTTVCTTVTVATEKWNNITLIVRYRGNYIQSYTKNVNQCIWLPKVNVTGKLVGVQLQDQGNCVEIYQFQDCMHDYITLKPGVPASSDLTKWNLNDKREWIVGEGAKAVGPCRDECDETIISPPESDKNFRITLHSELNLAGLMESVTIKGCKVIPKPLRNKASSLTYDGSFCVELHQTRDCSGDSIRIPKKTPYQLLYDLQAWGFDKKAVAVSRCGYNCSISRLKSEKEEFSIKRWTGDTEYEVGVTLYSEPDFEGENQTYTFNRTDGTCFYVPDVWNKKGKTESIQPYNFCIDVFEKNIGCERVEGEYHRLNYSNEKGRDIIQLGWSGGIKAIALCPTNAPSVVISPPEDTSNFWIYLITGFSIALVIVAIILIRKFPICRQRYSQVLTKEEIDEFWNGSGADVIEMEEHVFLKPENQPFDKDFEIPKQYFNIDTTTILEQGQFSTTYRGTTHPPNSRDELLSAIKSVDSNARVEFIRSLLKHVKLLIYAGEHPNIVKLIGCYTQNIINASAELYVITELCNNGSLQHFLRDNHTLLVNSLEPNNPPDILGTTAEEINSNCKDVFKINGSTFKTFHFIRWCLQIAKAMEHLSSKLIVHGDLGTKTVLLTEDFIVKVADAGLSMQLYSDIDYVKKQKIALPWRSMAIESLRNSQFTLESDIWTFGITLWEIFTLGQTPYSEFEAKNCPPSFVDDLSKGLRPPKPNYASDEIFELMQRCWKLNNAHRPQFPVLRQKFEELLAVSRKNKVAGIRVD